MTAVGRALLLAPALVLALATAADAETAPRATIDRVAVRYYAPETGGSGHPRFVSERMLAFEARLDALADTLVDAIGAELGHAPRMALFGHSMGAALAFECALRLSARGRAPVALIVSGRGPNTARSPPALTMPWAIPRSRSAATARSTA